MSAVKSSHPIPVFYGSFFAGVLRRLSLSNTSDSGLTPFNERFHSLKQTLKIRGRVMSRDST